MDGECQPLEIVYNCGMQELNLTRLLFLGMYVLLCLSTCFEATGQTVFQKSVTAYSSGLRPTHDGGYITSGAQGCATHGDFDVSLSKIDSAFQVQWSARYGTASSNSGRWVIQSSDHGYVMTGRSHEMSPHDQVSAMKVDTNGVIQWVKAFDFSQYSATSHEIIETADGGYLIVGGISGEGGQGDIFLIKLTSSGQMQWNKRYDTGVGEHGGRVLALANGGYLIAGGIGYDDGTVDVLLLRVDSMGSVIWCRAYDGPGRFEFDDLIATHDGGYALLCYTRFTGSQLGEFLLLKLNSGATVSWSKIYRHAENDQPSRLLQLPDSGYVLVGGNRQLYLADNPDPFVIRTDALGRVVWSREYGGIASQEARHVLLAPDGGLLIGVGVFNSASSSATMLIKTDLNGYSGCEQGNPVVVDSSIAVLYSSRTVQSANSFWQITDPVYATSWCVGVPNVTICEVASLPLLATVSHTDVTCHDGNDGSAGVTGGMPWYSYSWNTTPPQTTAVATGLTAGQYTCTVTDTTGTYMTLTVNIMQPLAIAVSIDAPADTLLCEGDSLLLMVTGGEGLSLQWRVDGDTVPDATASSFMPLNSGTYDVMVTSQSTGCSSVSNSVAVMFETTEDVTVTHVGDVLSSTPGTGYQWYLNDEPIEGATGQSYTIVESGNYSVAVVSASGCEIHSNNLEMTFTAIEEIGTNSWFYWPNPSNGIFNLVMKNASGEVRIIVTDNMGREVLMENFSAKGNSARTIDMSGRASGIYFLRVQTENGAGVVKLVKE